MSTDLPKMQPEPEDEDVEGADVVDDDPPEPTDVPAEQLKP